MSAKNDPKMISRRIAEKLYVDGMKPQFTGPIDDAPENLLQDEKSYTTYSFSRLEVLATQVRVIHGIESRVR